MLTMQDAYITGLIMGSTLTLAVVGLILLAVCGWRNRRRLFGPDA